MRSSRRRRSRSASCASASASSPASSRRCRAPGGTGRRSDLRAAGRPMATAPLCPALIRAPPGDPAGAACRRQEGRRRLRPPAPCRRQRPHAMHRRGPGASRVLEERVRVLPRRGGGLRPLARSRPRRAGSIRRRTSGSASGSSSWRAVRDRPGPPRAVPARRPHRGAGGTGRPPRPGATAARVGSGAGRGSRIATGRRWAAVVATAGPEAECAGMGSPFALRPDGRIVHLRRRRGTLSRRGRRRTTQCTRHRCRALRGPR